MRKIGIRRLANDNKQSHSMAHDGVALVWLVSDTAIVREPDPTSTAYFLEPDFIWSIIREVVGVSLYPETALLEDLGKLLPKISIREKNRAQAARSETMACSTSAGPRS
jgi:hypothetical protein